MNTDDSNNISTTGGNLHFCFPSPRMIENKTP